MRLFERLAHLVNVRTAIAFGALLTVAAPVTAQPEVVIGAATPTVIAGKWAVATDSSAAGGKAIRHADADGDKLSEAQASPANYFELTFPASDNTPYRLWIRGKAESDHWGNDSVFVQFDKSVTSSGAATYRIGSTSGATVNLEDCSGCGLNGWKWQDNGYGSGSLGSLVYFSTTGTQKVRVQTREDGLSIDQIVLSPLSYLSAAPSGTLATTVAPPTTTTPPTTSASTLKVFDWNTHHGVGMDGVYNIAAFVPYIVKSGANVVSLNEVERYVGSYGNEDQPARYAAMLKAQTGKTWYYNFAQRDGATNGQGNLLLTTFPIEDQSDRQLSYSRSVARIQILVNGIRVNVFSTHLDADSSTRRATQMNEMKSWASSFAEQRIFAGDFNAWPGAAEIANLTSAYLDTWAVAKANGTAVAYSGNEAGNTRNSRIDYVWLSKSATRTTIKASQVYDISAGVDPSDHRPVMTTFEVK